MRKHTVVRSDTLSAIARTFDMTVADILAANPGIKDADKIIPGQVILIPDGNKEENDVNVHYELNNQGGEWLEEDQGDDDSLVAPAGGLHGLAISLDDPAVHVEYRIFADNKWSEVSKDGERASNNDKPITAIRASLSPRRNRHIVYTVSWFDPVAKKQETVIGRDNVVVGSDAAAAPTLLKLRMRVEKD